MPNANLTVYDLTALPALAEIKSVYSGKDGKCCCGCAGKYYYAKAHQQAGGKGRGYAVSDDEVSDTMVKNVYGIIMQAITDGKAEYGGNNISTIVGTRLYIIYPTDAYLNDDAPEAIC